MRRLLIIFIIAQLSEIANAQSVVERFGFRPPNEGVFRVCETMTDCTPTKECSFRPRDDCFVSVECRRCQGLLGTKVCFNDPSCEGIKAIKRAQCEAETAARKADCEVSKSIGRAKCEAERDAAKAQCNTVRSEEIAKANEDLPSLTGDLHSVSFQPLKVATGSENLIASAFGLQNLSHLDFAIVAPESQIRALIAKMRYGQSLVTESAIPKLFWMGPPDARSYRNVTLIALDRDVSTRDVVRAAVIAELFKMKAEELAQLKVSSSFGLNEFVNQATDQICGNESLVDKGLDCKKLASLSRPSSLN